MNNLEKMRMIIMYILNICEFNNKKEKKKERERNARKYERIYVKYIFDIINIK